MWFLQEMLFFKFTYLTGLSISRFIYDTVSALTQFVHTFIASISLINFQGIVALLSLFIIWVIILHWLVNNYISWGNLITDH